MTSFMTRSKSKWSSSHESFHTDDTSLENENSVDETSPYVYYSVLCTSDSKGNITLDNVKTERFDSDVKTITTDSESGEEEIDDMKEQRYGFRTRRSKKYEDDEFESSLGADLTDHSSDEVIQPVPSSDDETYDITTDNWTFVRGAKRKIEGGEKKTSPKRVKKKVQRNSLRIKFKSKFFKIKKNIINNHKGFVNTKNSSLDKSKLLNVAKKRVQDTDSKIKPSTTNTPETVATTATATTCSDKTSSTVASSSLLPPSITKKLSHKIRCGYNATSSKIPEIRHIRRRRLNRALRNEGSPKDDISTSSEDERENKNTTRLSRSKRRKSSALPTSTVGTSRRQQSEVTSIGSNYQFPVKTSNNGLKIVIRRQSSDSINSINATKTTDPRSITSMNSTVSETPPYLKPMTSSANEIQDNSQSEKRTAELSRKLPEATVVLERSFDTRSSIVDSNLDEKEVAEEQSNEEVEEQNDEDKIQKELSTFVHHRPYKIQETNSGSKFSDSKLRRNLKTVKTKKRRRKKREDKDVVDSIDSKRTAMRLDMELPGHNWLLKKHQIREKKMKKEGKVPLVVSSEDKTVVEQMLKSTGPHQASTNSKPITTESQRFQMDNQEDQACIKTTPNKGTSMVGIVKPFNHLRMATTIARENRDESPPRLLIVDEDDADREQARISLKEEMDKKFIDINVKRLGVDSLELPKITSSELVKHDVMTAVQKNREISVLTPIATACNEGTLTSTSQVNHNNKAAAENNSSADVNLASHINSQNVYSYKVPAFEIPMEVRMDRNSNINTFPVTAAREVNTKSTNNNEQSSSSTCDKAPMCPVPKEESSEIESTIKISNCVSLALDLSTKKMEEMNDEPLDLSVGKKASDSPEILDLSIKKFEPEMEPTEQRDSVDSEIMSVSRESVDEMKTSSNSDEQQTNKHDVKTNEVRSTEQTNQYRKQEPRSVITTDERKKGAKMARLMSPDANKTVLYVQSATCDPTAKKSSEKVPANNRSHDTPLLVKNDMIWKQPSVSRQSLLPMTRSLESQILKNTIFKANQSLLPTQSLKQELHNTSIRPSTGVNNKGQAVKFPSIPPHLPPVPPSRKIDLTIDPLIDRPATFNCVTAVNSNVIPSVVPDKQLASSKSVFPMKQVNGNVLSITSSVPQTSLLPFASSSLPTSNIAQRVAFPNSNITHSVNPSVLQTSLPPYVHKYQNKQVNNNAMAVNNSEVLIGPISPPNRQVSRHRSLDFPKSVHQPNAQQLEPIVSPQQRFFDKKIHDLEAVQRRLDEAVRKNRSNLSHIAAPPQISRPPPPNRIHQDNVRLPGPHIPIPVPKNIYGNERSAYKQPIPRATQPTSQPPYSRSTVLLSVPGHPYSEVVSPNILRNQGSRGVIQKAQLPRFDPNRRIELLSTHSSAPPFNRSASFPSQTKPPEFPVGFDPTVRIQRQVPAKSSRRHGHPVTQTRKPIQKMPPPQSPSSYVRNAQSKAQLNEPIVIDDDIIPSSPTTSQRQQRSSSVDGSTGVASRNRANFTPQFSNNPIRDQSNARQEFLRQTRSIDEVCVKCRKKAYFLCSGCRSVWYCSKKCQLNDWSKHAAKCNG